MTNSWIKIRSYETSDKRLHTHEAVEIAFAVSGKWFLNYASGTVELAPGEAAVCMGTSSHGWIAEPSSREQHELTLIHCNHQLLSRPLLNAPELDELSLLLEQAKRGVALHKSSLVQQNAPILEALPESKELNSFILLLQLLQNLCAVNQRSFASYEVNEKSPEAGDPIDHINRYLKLKFKERIRLEALAQLAGITSTSFSRYYKQHTGKTPFEELAIIRIAEACKLLRHTHLTIIEIAYECGYNQISLFNKQFSRIMGCTPSDFRKQK